MTEEVKRKIDLVNEAKAKGVSVSRACKDFDLSPTLYYYHKRQARIDKARKAQEARLENVPPSFEVNAVKAYKEKLKQAKLELLNQLGIE